MKNRIKELRWVLPGALEDDPRNWRMHPEAQREALQAVLDSVGIVDAVIARETEDGRLILIDGHLRRDMIAQEIPVLIVDLDEEESGQALATLDPIASMAETNADALRRLVEASNPPEAAMSVLEVLTKVHETTDAQVEQAAAQTEGRSAYSYDLECPECGHEFQTIIQ